MAKKADFYTIIVEDYHNFFAGNHHVLTHNFVIAIPIIAWSVTGFDIVCSAAFFSILLKALIDNLYYYFGKKVEKNINKDNAVNSAGTGNSGGSEDPEKKRNREKIKIDKEVDKEVAERHGYKFVKDGPFNSRGQDKYQKSSRYISRDIDGHKGGYWKMFKRNGDRIGTFDKEFTRQID